MSGDRVTQVTAGFSPAGREALRWFYFYCLDQDIPRNVAAERIGCESSTLFKVYKGSYLDAKGRPIEPGKMVEGIQRFRAEVESAQAQRARARRAEDVGFVLTPTAKKTWEVCELTAMTNRISFVWGASQVGKTMTLLEFKRQNNHGSTKYIRIEPSSVTHELMRQLARECAISAKTHHDALKERVVRAIDSRMLVIVDEIHELSFTYRLRSKLACFELLRWVHDKTRCGMLICGTNIGRDDLAEGKDKALLDQLRRRGVFQLQLGNQPNTGGLAGYF